MATFLSKFADVEFIFAGTMFSDNTFQRFFPNSVKIKIHKIAAIVSKFADVELLFERTIFSDKSYQNKGNLRHSPIQIYFDPYKVRRKRFWEEFFLKKVTRYLKRHKKDKTIVDGQGINAIPGINLGLPTVTTLHGVDNWIENPPKLEKTILNKANKIVAITKRIRSQLIKKGVEKERISVIYNGVDFQGISNTKLESNDFMVKYNVNPDKQMIISVHNFHKKKNTKRIIDSFVTIRRKYDDYQLVLIGDGVERQHYIDYVKTKKFNDVHFPGRIFSEDFYRFYKAADIFVLPSFGETWPIVYMEAMAAKCATILTKDSDMAELIEDKKQGLFVDPYDQEDIENALMCLIENDTLKRQIKAKGYKLVQKLSWEKQGKLFWDVLQEVMA